MKKSLALIIGLCIILTACTAGKPPEIIGDPTTTPPTSSQTTATTAHTETSCNTNTTDPSVTENTQSVISTEYNEKENICSDVDFAEVTLPPTTNPPERDQKDEPIYTETKEPESTEITSQDTVAPTEETTSTNEEVTPTESTELIIAGLDCEAAMNAGNQYGIAVYGWVLDASLNESNAGFNFGSWVFAEEGQDQLNAAAVAQINFLYNDLKTVYPNQDITGIRFRVHAFECGDGLYEVRVYYA